MKVVHIVPGSGGTFYCQNCLRDSLIMPALARMGLDVTLVPMYLRHFDHETTLAKDVPVFFGALNVYLQQKTALFRKTPRWLDKILDARGLLELVARKASSTRAAGLEEMTLSMLRGDTGRQAKELTRLLAWLKTEVKPDIVHLSNALLLGLAPSIRQELDCRVVCSLQDEDVWVDSMRSEYVDAVWTAMAKNTHAVDMFVPASRYYSEVMGQRLALPPQKMQVIYMGVPLEAYEYDEHAPDPQAIGYVSRLAESQGLGVLLDAFMLLKDGGGFDSLRLRATGGMTGSDARFMRGLKRRIRRAGLSASVDFLAGFSRAERAALMRTVSLISVPVVKGEAFSLHLLEAMASGRPVVQPRVGAFAEILEATGGGILYEPRGPHALAEALDGLLRDPQRAAELSRAGRQAVKRSFTIENTARQLTDLYDRLDSRAGLRDMEPHQWTIRLH